MRQHALRSFGVGALVAIAAGGAWAASVHFKPGSPSFVDTGANLTAFGDLAGVGNVNLLVTLAASGEGDCFNPGSGEHRPPGQNPLVVSGAQAIPASEIKNGTVPFNVTTTGDFCPNDNWTSLLSFSSATLEVEQPAGTVVLSTTCTFTPPTVDGGVPASSVSCN